MTPKSSISYEKILANHGSQKCPSTVFRGGFSSLAKVQKLIWLLTNKFHPSIEDLFCDEGHIWDGNRLLVKDLLKWSVIDGVGGGGMQLKYRTHFSMATY